MLKYDIMMVFYDTESANSEDEFVESSYATLEEAKLKMRENKANWSYGNHPDDTRAVVPELSDDDMILQIWEHGKADLMARMRIVERAT